MASVLDILRRGAELEWLGGRYKFPQTVQDGDAVFYPDLVLWLELPTRTLVATKMMNPAKARSLGELLVETMRHPAKGPPRRPSRIRVRDEDMAREVGTSAGGIPVVVAPVPELDDWFKRFVVAYSSPHLRLDRTPATLTGPSLDKAFINTPSVPPSPARSAGRNDPCPCGSGKKFKKCHLERDRKPRP